MKDEETRNALRARLDELTRLHLEHEQAHAVAALEVAEGAQGAAVAMNAALQGMANSEAERKAVMAAIDELGKRGHREAAERQLAKLDTALHSVMGAAGALAVTKQSAIEAARAAKLAWDAMIQAQEVLTQAHRWCGQDDYQEAHRPHNNRLHENRAAPETPDFLRDMKSLWQSDDIVSSEFARPHIDQALKHAGFAKSRIRKELAETLADAAG